MEIHRLPLWLKLLNSANRIIVLTGTRALLKKSPTCINDLRRLQCFISKQLIQNKQKPNQALHCITNECFSFELSFRQKRIK